MAAELPVHISPTLIARKVNKLLGRLCFNYSLKGGLNDDDKRDLLALAWGEINLPQLVQWCRVWERVRVAFPDETLMGYATDYDSWYRRALVALSSACLYSTSFTIDGVEHIFIPLVEQFGAQDSGYHSNLGSRLLYAHMSLRHQRQWGVTLACQYIDDTAGFGPLRIIADEVQALDRDATAAVGEGALASHKTRIQDVIEANGWAWTAADGTFTITYSILLRMICVLFLELPMSVSVGDPCPSNTLERLAAYCLRACSALPSMWSFSRGASHNLAKYAASRSVPLLTAQTVVDINAWRAAFQLAFTDASWLVTPTFVPMLLASPETSDLGELLSVSDRARIKACTQASAARFISHSDACTDYTAAGFALSAGTGVPNIDGLAVDPFGWGYAEFPQLASFFADVDAVLPGAAAHNRHDINLLEMFGSVISVLSLESLLLNQSPLVQPDGRHRGLIHVHTWTDNTSALSWLTSHRSAHPLHAFLLQTLSFVSQRSRLLLTFGHVPGVLNTTADAISRRFNVPAGPAVLRRLANATFCPASQSFIASLIAVSNSVSADPFGSVRAALTALA
jgi:hypothetical protein